MTDEIEPSGDNSPLPFQELPFPDLVAPQPIDATPPEAARWLAFVAILAGGLLGALVGYGIGDLMGGSTGAVTGAVVGGLTGAVGIGTLANLTLRAMNEWRTVEHPEAKTSPSDTDRDTENNTGNNTDNNTENDTDAPANDAEGQ